MATMVPSMVGEMFCTIARACSALSHFSVVESSNVWRGEVLSREHVLCRMLLYTTMQGSW